jgi:hypothetical protein
MENTKIILNVIVRVCSSGNEVSCILCMCLTLRFQTLFFGTL